jgi:hypothetical protein
LLDRIHAMTLGYTYLERGSDGAVENTALRPFESFDACCAAARDAVAVQAVHNVAMTQVVYCRYEDDMNGCIPDMQPVLKTFERPNAP